MQPSTRSLNKSARLGLSRVKTQSLLYAVATERYPALRLTIFWEIPSLAFPLGSGMNANRWLKALKQKGYVNPVPWMLCPRASSRGINVERGVVLLRSGRTQAGCIPRERRQGENAHGYPTIRTKTFAWD